MQFPADRRRSGITGGVFPPIFVRPLTDAERQQVEAGLRSSEAFVLRRCQIVLASARGERATIIARQLGCDDQTMREAIHAFNTTGLAARGGPTPSGRLSMPTRLSGCAPCSTRVRARSTNPPVYGPWRSRPRSASNKA